MKDDRKKPEEGLTPDKKTILDQSMKEALQRVSPKEEAEAFLKIAEVFEILERDRDATIRVFKWIAMRQVDLYRSRSEVAKETADRLVKILEEKFPEEPQANDEETKKSTTGSD